MLEAWQENRLIKKIGAPILKFLMDGKRDNDLRYYLNFLLLTGLVSQSTSRLLDDSRDLEVEMVYATNLGEMRAFGPLGRSSTLAARSPRISIRWCGRDSASLGHRPIENL